MTRRVSASHARQAWCSRAFTGVGGVKEKGRDLYRTATRGELVVRAAYPDRRLFEAGLLAVEAAARPLKQPPGASPMIEPSSFYHGWFPDSGRSDRGQLGSGTRTRRYSFSAGFVALSTDAAPKSLPMAGAATKRR